MTTPIMDDMLAAHRRDLRPDLRKTSRGLAELRQAMQDAVEDPATVKADVFAGLLRDAAAALQKLATDVDAGMPDGTE